MLKISTSTVVGTAERESRVVVYAKALITVDDRITAVTRPCVKVSSCEIDGFTSV
jgi:hypothetical protein